MFAKIVGKIIVADSGPGPAFKTVRLPDLRCDMVAVAGVQVLAHLTRENTPGTFSLSKVLERLDRLNLGTEHSGLGKATLTVTQIKSAPDISHTVPDTCRITLDRRLLPGDDPDVALGSIRDAVANMSPWSVEVTRGAFMYPSEVGADCAVAAAVRHAGRALNEQDGEVFYSPAALDAGHLNQRGIETIMFGPGDLRFAHTDQEVVSVQEVRDAARIYAATALELLA
jgi:acetylornithine deacetylase/succinyl-diaminopimelate desuccinylase-like protein